MVCRDGVERRVRYTHLDFSLAVRPALRDWPGSGYKCPKQAPALRAKWDGCHGGQSVRDQSASGFARGVDGGAVRRGRSPPAAREGKRRRPHRRPRRPRRSRRNGAAPTAEEAKAFVAKAEAAIEAAQTYAQRASWVRNTFITDDTEILEAKAIGEDTELESRLAREAHRFDHVDVDPVTRRKLDIMERNLVLPAADRAGAAEELATISSRLSSTYAKGTFRLPCKRPTRSHTALVASTRREEVLRTSRDPAELQAVWEGWHTISTPMRADYPKLVELANEGARSLGYADTGVLWRSKYDMDPAAFAQLTDKLWSQVMPFYKNLHCYVRARLNEKYGNAVQPRTGPIRADLLGNMWAQEWGNIYDVVAPKGMHSSYNLDQLLASHGYTPRLTGATPDIQPAIKMMKHGEAFYSSIGFDPLPDTFWTRTQFVRPRDREVNCHASAWDIDGRSDLRIKMCISGTADDFFTVHHELGHNYYQRAYANQDWLFRDGANDGFHEAIGDFAGLNAVTPTYLHQIGLLATVPGPQEDVPLPAAPRARQRRVPAVRPAGRQMALGSVRGPHHARAVQRRLVGAGEAVSGRGAAGAAAGRRVRSGRQVPHRGFDAVHALLPGAHLRVPVLPRRLQAGRLDRDR